MSLIKINESNNIYSEEAEVRVTSSRFAGGSIYYTNMSKINKFTETNINMFLKKKNQWTCNIYILHAREDLYAQIVCVIVTLKVLICLKVCTVKHKSL